MFSNKMVFRAGIHKPFVSIANREDPGQTDSSDLGLPGFSRHFWQTTSVRNFTTFTTYLGWYLAPLESVPALLLLSGHKLW